MRPATLPKPTTLFKAACLLAALLTLASTSTLLAKGADGLYAATEDNYQIEVKFSPGKLTVVEPNKTSVYTQQPGTEIYHFTNPNNGISYILEVTGPKSLKAYKPGYEGNFTPLVLVRPAAGARGSEKEATAATPRPAAKKIAGLERIPLRNKTAWNPDLEPLWGTRQLERGTPAGTYLPEGEAGPALQLNANGTGKMEMHGAPKKEHVYSISQWWIQTNADGSYIREEGPNAKQYYLIVQFARPYQGLTFHRFNMAQTNAGAIHVLDRVKMAGR